MFASQLCEESFLNFLLIESSWIFQKVSSKKGHTFSSDPISVGWMTSNYIKFSPWLLNPFRINVVIKLDHLPKKWNIEIVNETIEESIPFLYYLFPTTGELLLLGILVRSSDSKMKPPP